MNEATFQAITAELLPLLKGKKFGKIFLLSRLSLAIDMRMADGGYLFMGFETNPAPRLYLINRKVKDLEKKSRHPSPFVLLMRKRLANAVMTGIEKLKNERIVRFDLLGEDELGDQKAYSLLAQFTGRSADLFLLDGDGRIIDSLRDTALNGEKYEPPASDTAVPTKTDKVFQRGRAASLSEALDAHYQKLEDDKAFVAHAKKSTDEIKREIKKREKLRDNLQKDLTAHGDIEQLKRLGDLLLSNPNAKVENGKVSVTDFYSDEMPQIEIAIEDGVTPAQAAQKYFASYTKAKRAVSEIPRRILTVAEEIIVLRQRLEKMQSFVDTKDAVALGHFVRKENEQITEKVKEKERTKENVNTGYRSVVSSDGFEILVGRGAKDNDTVTFRVGKSQDLWLHAADYPGSHVIVRNPNRKEIPQKTLLEAAQLAAFYSQAKKEAKAAVNYTQQKNVSKIKGGAPGLVRISTFKTIMVEPKKIEEK